MLFHFRNWHKKLTGRNNLVHHKKLCEHPQYIMFFNQTKISMYHLLYFASWFGQVINYCLFDTYQAKQLDHKAIPLTLACASCQCYGMTLASSAGPSRSRARVAPARAADTAPSPRTPCPCTHCPHPGCGRWRWYKNEIASCMLKQNMNFKLTPDCLKCLIYREVPEL